MLNLWHNWLDLPKFDKQWYIDDLRDELKELAEETNLLKKWSELSDVTYTLSRSRWSDNEVPNPLNPVSYLLGVIYMLPKYTLRYLYFRSAGRKAGANKDIKWIRNPDKLQKLSDLITEQNIEVDLDKLTKICEKQRSYWLLLP